MLCPPDHVRAVLTALQDAGHEAFLVGGCVRDSLLGRVPTDWDVCTSALPEQVKSIFDSCQLLEMGISHGTIAVLTGGGMVEVTTYRSDGPYADHRHPEHVTFVPSLCEDLARRDFTVNAMAAGLAGEVIDPFGGQEDLAAGIIRCVGEPDTRFGEDALRMMRALRFAARLDFQIEPQTARSLRKNRTLLARVAPERIFAELRGLLVGVGVGRILRDHSDVIFEIIPELTSLRGFDQRSPHHIHDIWTHTTMAVDAIEPDTVLRLTMLLHDVGKPARFFTDEDGVGHFYGHADTGAEMADAILRRLRSDNATRKAVVTLIQYHDMAPPTTVRSMRRLVEKLGVDTVRKLIACWRADSSDRAETVVRRNFAVIDASEATLEELLRNMSCFSRKDLAVNGRDMLALGMPEGPVVGRTLQELFRLVTEGEVPNERPALLDAALYLLGKN